MACSPEFRTLLTRPDSTAGWGQAAAVSTNGSIVVNAAYSLFITLRQCAALQLYMLGIDVEESPINR